jgi:hypothetical protein
MLNQNNTDSEIPIDSAIIRTALASSSSASGMPQSGDGISGRHHVELAALFFDGHRRESLSIPLIGEARSC